MVFVKGGTFEMGCTPEQKKAFCYGNESPTQTVSVNDFYIGKYEVTVGEYHAFLIDTKRTESPPQSSNENYPVMVTKRQAEEYCQWLSQKTGREYSLPTEKEWEYAARAASVYPPTVFSGSDNIDEVAWYDSNSNNQLQKVGEKKPNALGIFDMSGNVWEWCADFYYFVEEPDETDQTDYSEEEMNYVRPVAGLLLRGGGYNSTPRGCRVAVRVRYSPVDFEDSNIGFRVVHKP